jgi:hypothetical protein
LRLTRPISDSITVHLEHHVSWISTRTKAHFVVTPLVTFVRVYRRRVPLDRTCPGAHCAVGKSAVRPEHCAHCGGDVLGCDGCRHRLAFPRCAGVLVRQAQLHARGTVNYTHSDWVQLTEKKILHMIDHGIHELDRLLGDAQVRVDLL